MKKIIIISDTHGNVKAVENLLPLIAENDYVIHLGDGCADMKQLWQAYPDKVYQCRGNCDGFTPTPLDGEIEIEYLKIFYCHGDRYGVKSGLLRLFMAAKEKAVHIALFGHTHCAYCEEKDHLWLMNPGSCGKYGRVTYGTVEIRGGAVICTVKALDERNDKNDFGD